MEIMQRKNARSKNKKRKIGAKKPRKVAISQIGQGNRKKFD
jgi:hypothetical protein